MTRAPHLKRWKVLAEWLRASRERGELCVIAASTKVPEYKLHDFAKIEGSDVLPITPYEFRKLYAHFKGRPQR